MVGNLNYYLMIRRCFCFAFCKKRFRNAFIFAVFFCLIEISVVSATYNYQGTNYDKQSISTYNRGKIVEYTNEEEFCHSWVHIPGTPLIANWLLGIVYFVAMIYLCLGITVGSDTLMDSIEMITSQTKKVTYTDVDGKEQTMEVCIWNPTIANLALMTLGSSASIIMLNIIQAIEDLGSTTGNLGAGTIIGSVSYNTLIITGVSIVCIPTGTTKHINSLVIFILSVICCALVYVWIVICLEVWTKGVISLAEALITLGLFPIYLLISFIIDKIKECRERRLKNKLSQLKEEDYHNILNVNREKVNNLDQQNEDEDHSAVEANIHQAQEYLKEKFNTEDLNDIKLEEIKDLLQPKSVVADRILFKKSIGTLITGKQKVSVGKDESYSLQLKEANENLTRSQLNPDIGFRCLHYAVTETMGFLFVVIERKCEGYDDKRLDKRISFGVKTVDGTAKAGVDDKLGDYIPFDEEMIMEPGIRELTVQVKIVNDDELEPDEDFYILLYDLKTKDRLKGEDTQTTITILDEDRPGIFGFEKIKARVRPKDEKIRLRVLRLDGCDDDVKIKYKTFIPEGIKNTADPALDYKHEEGVITFECGETMKPIEIKILSRLAKDFEDREDIFGVKIFEPLYAIEHKNKTDGIKFPRLSKRKNECMVSIIGDFEDIEKPRGIEENLEDFDHKGNITWGRQIIKACILSSQLDEKLNVIEVTWYNCLLHFCTIGWKLLFALTPPPRYCKGWFTFLLCIILVGAITALLGEFAKLFGCIIGLHDPAMGLTFVAVCISIPETYSCIQAAKYSVHADNAIGNIASTNSIIAFLGFGIAWTIGAVYSKIKGVDYRISNSEISFSIIVYLIASAIIFTLLLLRRCIFKGEIGGYRCFWKWSSAFICFTLWIAYVVLSVLKIYNKIF